jgi:serine/threonine protein kinase
MPTTLEQLSATLADRYRVEREVGQGGMATVYLASDLKHGRKLAIKVLRPDLAAVIGAERFVREIRTIANLQHPHILGLIDSGEVGGTAYYVMPYVDGESLRDRLRREQQLPVVDAVRLATEVAAALDYAHRQGVIHRDIKPENILLQDGSALVADFGIALALSTTGGTRMTEAGMSLGTPQYMSPEQAMGERTITARSDVYSLGCVLYEMLLGEPPFTGATAQAIVAKMMMEKPAPLRVWRETVPETVERAILTALQKLPADRFRSTAEFAAALAAHPETAPTPARGPGSDLIAGSFFLSEVTCRRLSRASFDPRLIGTELQYLDNRASSPVLVCLIPEWARASDQNVAMLSRIPYRTVIPTFRGFEPVTPWRPNLTIEDHIVLIREFLSDLVARVKPRRVVLLGFATGADIALRFAATPDPESRLQVDGCLALGGNLSISTCFVTKTMASLKGNDDADMLAVLRQVSNTAALLDEWVNFCEYAIRIVGMFRHNADPVRTFAAGIAAPFEREDLGAFVNWYQAATTSGTRLRCVFEDTPMYRGLVRELQLRNLDEGLLGGRYQEGSIITEAGTSHFDLVEPSRVARHLETLVSWLGAGGA